MPGYYGGRSDDHPRLHDTLTRLTPSCCATQCCARQLPVWPRGRTVYTCDTALTTVERFPPCFTSARRSVWLILRAIPLRMNRLPIRGCVLRSGIAGTSLSFSGESTLPASDAGAFFLREGANEARSNREDHPRCRGPDGGTYFATQGV